MLLQHSPPGRRRSSRGHMAGHGKASRQAELEKVLGITASGSSSLTCDPNSGLVAYPAGCVIVLLCPRKNKQAHIFNTCSKPLSALSFSPDGKYIVSGESGHKPAVRIWDVAEKVQVSELLGHKYGVSCVCFSPNMKYVVSVGYQHDMVVNVWDWKNCNVVAKNKISSKVSTVSFSEDSSYFVTAGHRHVKFWYLDSSKQSKVGTVPLVGRSGLLGDLHNNVFGGVACGKGKNAGSTYCVSLSGILCQFNDKRVLEKWLKLKVSASYCLSVTEHLVFCGCEEGVVRIFGAHNLQYVADLPRPHHLGVDVALGLDPSSLFVKQTDSSYADTCALVYDEGNQWLCCVYNDHSIYVWDVSNTRKVGKVYSALYHSSYVWNIEVYPEMRRSHLSERSFFTCSSDNTIRLWNLERSPYPALKRNIYSNELHKVIYVEDNTQYLKDSSATNEKSEPKDSKSGIRVLKVSHNGLQLASGDRMGNIRIYDLHNFKEFLTIEAHDGEVLCLEYSSPLAGMTFLASASRDRLIHILCVERNYTLLQTLDDHSSSITAVKFAGNAEEMHMISCGADKSIYFRPAQVLPDGINFLRLHHAVEKTTLYDLDIDATQKIAAVACQDKTIRFYNVTSGKQEKTIKSSQSAGALLKVQMDPSGRFLATSCSNKNISLFDLQSGDCVAMMYGHSDIVTDMKFTYDCKRLITVSGDSCVFIWQLDPIMSACMKQHIEENSLAGKIATVIDDQNHMTLRRETFLVDFLDESSHDDLFLDKSCNADEPSVDTPSRDHFEGDPSYLQTNGRMPLWARKLQGEQNEPLIVLSQNHYKPQGRWAQSTNSDVLRNFLNTNDMSYCGTPCQAENSLLDDTVDLECAEPKSFQQMLEQSEERNEDYSNGTFIMDMSAALEDIDAHSNDSNGIFYPPSLQTSQQEESDFSVEERTFDKGHDTNPNEQLSACDPDEDSLPSGNCSDLDENDVEENSETPEESFIMKHFDTLTDELAEEKFDNSLKDLKPNDDESDLFLNHRLSFSAKFLSRSHRNDRLESLFPPQIPQVVIDGEAKVESTKPQLSRKLSDKAVEKTSHVQERRKSSTSADIAILVPNLQKVHDKSSSRSSFPGCWPNKNNSLNKPNKGPSYMEATASFKAKISRSASMGEGINAGEDQRRLFNLFRPLSTNDLPSENGKLKTSEETVGKPLPTAAPCKLVTSVQQETKTKSTGSPNLISDKLLMPPPATYGVIPRLKKKSKSINNLPKMTRKEDLNTTVVKSKASEPQKNGITNDLPDRRNSTSSSTCRAADVHDVPRRASIAECPVLSTLSLSPTYKKSEEAVSPNRHLPTSQTPASNNVEDPNCSSIDMKDLMGQCEQVIDELHSTFQKTLKTFKEIENCVGPNEEKSHLRSLFFNAFSHIQSELELLGSCQRMAPNGKPNTENNASLLLLEHYSEMMLKIMREKINSTAL